MNHLTESAIEALEMLAEKPRETWRCNLPGNGWIGGRTAASLVRRGLAKYAYKTSPLVNLWDFDRKVEITPAGRDWLKSRES